MSDLKTNLGAILATDFSEGDFGIKKNLAIGALAASAALNPMKANASLPVRSDGMFYTGDDNPYPIGMFDKRTGERVTDPKKVYNATKDYQYYVNMGAYAPSLSGKDLPEITEHNRVMQDRALKQTELDEKNKLWYGDGKDVVHDNAYEERGGLGHKYFNTRKDPGHDYKALINGRWRDIDQLGYPKNLTFKHQFSEGDFGIKKNLAIGALAASAALNPMKANASLPIRTDGLFYPSESNPYPVGIFDQVTGERVTDPKEVYKLTKNFNYYQLYGAKGLEPGKKLSWGKADKDNAEKRDIALKQTELDQKNKMWYGEGKVDRNSSVPMDSGRIGEFRTDPYYDYKAFVDNKWYDVDKHGKPIGSREKVFSEGDFGIKKNLAIGALAASAALNPMKASASLPVRSDGMFYTSEFNPYPIGMFDKKTGERVTDPKKVYEATKNYQYYFNPGAYAPSVSGKDLPEITEHNNTQRDRALKQTELDEKNKLWYGDGKDVIRDEAYENGAKGSLFRKDLDPSHEYKALINHHWRSVDNHGKPRNLTLNDLNFSEGDFGIKKNLAIGALAASAALNPMKANASVPVRSDGMFYTSEENPYPIGMFDKETGERVKDPKKVYEATKRYTYYDTKARSGDPKFRMSAVKDANYKARENALKQTELDEKNQHRFGDSQPLYAEDPDPYDITYFHIPSDSKYKYKAYVDGGWTDEVDSFGRPFNTIRKRYFSEQVDLLSGKARKANVKKEAQDLESLKRRIDLIPDPSVRDALNKDWESLNKDRVSRAWVRIPGKVGVAGSLASVPATLATMAVAPAVALPLAAIGGAGLAFSSNQVRVANRAALRPAIDQLEEKVRKAEQDTLYTRVMANPASAQLPAKA